MSYSNLVIVESPAKAKTIEKYLGSDYHVLASMGHVRDLPPKNGSVDPEQKFSMTWEVDSGSKKTISGIKSALKKADTLYLATDPDREGEAISWHLNEILKEGNALKGKTVRRVTFNEITKSAVKEAFDHARDLDDNLIDAYKARRALDYLVGFTLSPILWRKLPGSRSAGRVQSVALRLICEREREIEKFETTEYWSVSAGFKTQRQDAFEARLTHFNGEKLKKFSIENEDQAKAIVLKAESQNYSIASIEKKQVNRNPAAPFITSTLQQEASRKLGFSASRTMQTAQKLYEGAQIDGETVGLITYMRTDGTDLSAEAIKNAREVIAEEFGKDYVPSSPRTYKSKAKNAQEAHEAIRPTSLSRRPEDVKQYLNEDQARLYELIWKRTLACQMASAKLDQVAVDITSKDQKTTFRANGSVVAFAGFLKVYFESRDDEEQASDAADNNPMSDRLLPVMNEGEGAELDNVQSEQHFTQPPPRYSEASLVKSMEELGIGRPSTYASIIRVLQQRNYVTIDRRRFIPEDRGRIVTAFLQEFFPKYVEYDFTAELEDELDNISGGRLDREKLLFDFWDSFKAKIDETKDLRIKEVIRVLNLELENMLYPERENGSDRRSCTVCADGRISLKLGRYGAFIGCSNYPECKYTRPLVANEEDEEKAQQAAKGPQVLGVDPKTGREISLKMGPYGPYYELAADPEVKKAKPKRASLPKGQNIEDANLEQAVDLLRLPRDVGAHPETGEMITAAIGRYGPYLKHEGVFSSIPKDDDVYTIGINRAVVIIAEAAEKKKKRGKKPPAGKQKPAAKKRVPAKKKATAKKTTSKK